MCCYLVPLAQCHIGSAWRVKLALVISRSVGHSYLLCTCCMPGPALGARNEKNGNPAPGANTSTDTCPPWCSQAILFFPPSQMASYCWLSNIQAPNEVTPEG